MPLSLTCSCGAKLEIDDKFAGKVIPCPDCHRELSTAPKVVQADRTSMFAVASVLLAIVGAFSVVGPVLAMICGLIALRSIVRHPEKLDGRRFAWAGIILGAIFTAAGVLALLSPEVLGIDGIFREIEWAKKLEHGGELQIDNKDSNSVTVKFAITRPSRSWGKLHSTTDSQRTSEDLILIDPWTDSQVACMNDADMRTDNPDENDLMDDALDFFLNKSELIQVLSRGSKTAPKAAIEQARDKKQLASAKGATTVEFVIDLKLAGIDHTFLLRAMRTDDRPRKMNLLAAGTRQSRFRRLEPELRTILDSYRVQH